MLEYDGASGATQRWYSDGLGLDDVLNRMDVAATTRTTLIPDIQGSIVGALASDGTLTRTGYQPFGENPSLTTAGFAYTARRLDPETAGSAAQPSGLYDYRARTYSPTWGRFLQPDPLGYAPDTNLYAYVGNDPLNATDPSGLFTLQIGVAGGGTLLGFVVPQGGFGIALDTHGNIGTYSYTGVGAGIGVEAGVGGSVQFSNAKTIYDLSDSFSNSSVHGGAGVGGSVDYFTGNSANGPVIGGGISFGASSGASASLTQTSTQICGSSGCVGSALPPVLSGAATLIAPGTAAANPTRSPSLK